MNSPLAPDLDDGPSERSDMELVALTRVGDHDAFAVLWGRHYHAAMRVARSITNKFDPEDIVQEAFTRIFQAIQGNRGPQDIFRSYLYATLRSVSMNWGRDGQHESPLDEVYLDQEPSYSFEVQLVDRAITTQAFASLKTEWRAVLWYLEVEGMKPREVAPLLGVSANAISALAYRARETLRGAWLQEHLNSDGASSECKWSVERLGAYNRRILSPRARNRLEEHLTSCLKCSILVQEVDHLGKNLGFALLPLVLGSHAVTLMDDISLGTVSAGAVPPSPVQGHHIGLGYTTKQTWGLLIAAVAATGIIAVGLTLTSTTPTNPPTAAMAFKSATRPEQLVNSRPSLPEEAAAAATPSRTPALSVDVPVPSLGIDSVTDPQAPSIETDGSPGDLLNPQLASQAPTTPEPLPTTPVSMPVPDPTPAATQAPTPTASAPASPVTTPTPTPTPTATAPPVTPTPTETEPAVPTVLDMPIIATVAEQGLFLPVIRGTGAPGAVVTVFSGGEAVGSALANEVGEWSLIPQLLMTAAQPVSFSAYQERGNQVSATTAATAPLSLTTPKLRAIEPTVDGGIVSFSGPAGSTVEVFVDGVPTGNLHRMDGSQVNRELPVLTLGRHSLMLRFVDETQEQHGAGLSAEFDVPQRSHGRLPGRSAASLLPL